MNRLDDWTEISVFDAPKFEEYTFILSAEKNWDTDVILELRCRCTMRAQFLVCSPSTLMHVYCEGIPLRNHIAVLTASYAGRLLWRRMSQLTVEWQRRRYRFDSLKTQRRVLLYGMMCP